MSSIKEPLSPCRIWAHNYIKNNATTDDDRGVELHGASARFLKKADAGGAKDGVVNETELALAIATSTTAKISVLKDLLYKELYGPTSMYEEYLNPLNTLASGGNIQAKAVLVDFEARLEIEKGNFKGAKEILKDAIFAKPAIKDFIKDEKSYKLLFENPKLLDFFEALAKDHSGWTVAAKELEAYPKSPNIGRPFYFIDEASLADKKTVSAIVSRLPATSQLKKHLVDFMKEAKKQCGTIYVGGKKLKGNKIVLGGKTIGQYIDIYTDTERENIHYFIKLKAGNHQEYSLNGSFRLEITRNENPLITRIRIPTTYLTYNHDGLKAGEKGVLEIGSLATPRLATLQISTAKFSRVEAKQASEQRIYEDLFIRALASKEKTPTVKLAHRTMADKDHPEQYLSINDDDTLNIENIQGKGRVINLRHRMISALRNDLLDKFFDKPLKQKLLAILRNPKTKVSEDDLPALDTLAALSDQYFQIAGYPLFASYNSGWKEFGARVQTPLKKGHGSLVQNRVLSAFFERTVKPSQFKGAMKEAYESLSQEQKQKFAKGLRFELYYHYYTDTRLGAKDFLVKTLKDNRPFIVSINTHRIGVLPAVISSIKAGHPELTQEMSKVLIMSHCSSNRSMTATLTEEYPESFLVPAGTNRTVFPTAKPNLAAINAYVTGDTRNVVSRMKHAYQNPAAWEAPGRTYAFEADSDRDGLPGSIDPDPGFMNPTYWDRSTHTLFVNRKDGTEIEIKRFEEPRGGDDYDNAGNNFVIGHTNHYFVYEAKKYLSGIGKRIEEVRTSLLEKAEEPRPKTSKVTKK